MAGNLGSLVVSLEANIARFESDLGKAERVAKSTFDSITKAGDMAANAAKGIGLAMAGMAAGVGINTLVSKFEAVTASLAGLKEMSERTGASVENLSGMSAIARIGGRDLGEMESAITKMNKALHSSDDESKGAAKALAAMGLDITKLKQMDPAAAFMEIARAQEKFADDGGKAAVMMDILGKQGAKQIPLMHDMADAGELVTKTTTAQAAAADDYEKNLKRLTATKEALYKTISVELVPVMNSFVKVLIQANNETDGLRKSAKDLANDGSIRSWAETAAMGAAHVIDEFQLLKAIIIEIETPIERLGRNIYTLGALGGIMTSKSSLTEKGQAYTALEEENKKYFADLDARLAKNREPVSLFSDRMRAQFAADRQAKLVDEKDTSLSGYTSHGTSSGRAGKSDKSDPFGDWLKDLESRIKPAEQAIANFTKLQQDAETSGADLTKAEKVFYDLIQSPDWKVMDKPWKDLVRAQFEAANVAEKVAKNEKIVADLLAATPTAKLDEMRTKMLALANAFEKGRINEEMFIEAAQTLSGNLPAQMEKAVDGMDEFWKKGMGSMQSALADFLFDPFAKGADNMAYKFAQTIERMAADALAANILNSLFGDMGKTGKLDSNSLLGKGIGWLSSVLEFANGGIMTSNGPLPLNAYAGGGIANSPQLAMFGEGRTPEAYVPLPDGKRIPVAMQGGQQNAPSPQNIRIVNAFDHSVIGDYIGSAAGERIIFNAVRRNASAFRQAMA